MNVHFNSAAGSTARNVNSTYNELMGAVCDVNDLALIQDPASIS